MFVGCCAYSVTLMASAIIRDRIMNSPSVQSHYTGCRAFYSDVEKSDYLFITDDVGIRRSRRALRNQRQIDFRTIPVGMVGENHAGAGLLHDVAETLCGADVSLNGFRVHIEPDSTPQRDKMRRAVVFHG